MTTLEYEIVLAKAGYNKKYNREVTWDELRKSFLLYKRIPMIVAGGSHSGPIDPNNAVGFVDAKIDDENEVIRGNAIFFKEKFDSIPQEIQQNLAYNRKVHASLGYESYNDLRKIDHLAIGVKSPVFEDIGFNAEDTFRYEETEGINADAKESAEPETAKDTEIQALRAEVRELKDLILSLKPNEAPSQPTAPQEDVSETDIEEEKITTDNEEPPLLEPVFDGEADAPPAKPKVVPERVIPKETAPARTTPDGLFRLEGNTRIVSSKIGRPLDKAKEQPTE